ncbi:syntenin-1-like [Tigriopus californicus]|uniref:syntenin-1-like n=1 Tax=Tigriopus californicus TaxID=6832 RepID=UPI0027DA35B1|nr:syntenin-1-like [Tigriopus californicus]
MSSLYPSLEDMKVDQMMKAQEGLFRPAPSTAPATAPTAPTTSSLSMADNGLPYPVENASAPVYPGLSEFMGLELSSEMIRANMPEYLAENQTPIASDDGAWVVANTPQTHVALPQTNPSNTGNHGTMVAPLSASAPAFAVSQLSHGVRQVILCKDEQGKVGLKVKSINKGVFVCLVAKNSPAAMGGLRFGDQVLQINGDNVAGFNENKVHDIFKKAPVNNIVLAVRDRPFERTLTLHKDSTGHLGFQFKDGKITAIAVNSSAARNGLLIDHNLLEVNGQNVVGVKDKETTKLIDEGGQIVTITVIPNFLYQHMVKNMANSLVKKMMDHSMPDI